MASQYKKPKPKKSLQSSIITIGLILAVILAAAAKFTPLLSILGITARELPAGTMASALKRKTLDVDAPLDRKNAEAKILLDRAAQQKMLEEADRQRSQQEIATRNTAQEKAFNDWYKPAPDCANSHGKWAVTVKCGNDFIAAKKYFMENHPKR